MCEVVLDLINCLISVFFVQAETNLEDVCLNKICPDPDKRRIGDLASGEVILFFKELFPCGEKNGVLSQSLSGK